MFTEKLYIVEGLWIPSDPTGRAEMQVTLTNHSDEPLVGFRLSLSGPLLMAEEASPGCVIVSRSGSHCEICPLDQIALQPGDSWQARFTTTYKLMHWTDGIVSATVLDRDGRETPAVCPPTKSANSTTAPVIGVSTTVPLAGAVPLSIIPWPREVSVSGRRDVPSGLDILAATPDEHLALETFQDLVEHLFPSEGLVRAQSEGGLPVWFEVAQSLGTEAYALVFSNDGAVVQAASRPGYLYGLITLAQILRGARLHRQTFVFPADGTIVDTPEMSWRGSHFDVSRQFFASDEVAQFVRVLAWNKLNRFHWHLSDDEGWRVEINAFPELVKVGAWRGLGLPVSPQLGSGGSKYGGYYTQSVVKRIVELAGSLGIAVIPEIDIPGHCYAMLQALPSLKDNGENGIYLSGQRFANNSLNPAHDKVYEACETILDELLALFPGEWFHVGGDEVPEKAWSTSPMAGHLAADVGAGRANLQAHFLRRIQSYLISRGRIVGAWEEAADSDGIDQASSYLIGWRTLTANRELAARGYDVVVSPGQRYYLDMALAPDWHEPGASWAGWSSVERTYHYDPRANWSAGELAKFRGIQAAIWSEPMTDRGAFDRLVFPRISAIAETAWTPKDQKDFRRFAGASSLMPSLYQTSEARR